MAAFSGATGGEQTKIQAKIQGMTLPKLSTIFEDIGRDGEVKTFSASKPDATKIYKEKGKPRYFTFKGKQRAFTAILPKTVTRTKEEGKPRTSSVMESQAKTRHILGRRVSDPILVTK